MDLVADVGVVATVIFNVKYASNLDTWLITITIELISLFMHMFLMILWDIQVFKMLILILMLPMVFLLST